ncbi:DUF6542 domain-containing protein [Streptomyces sp. NPDC102278]|uniref:DUF6542 domain-containing protein n=1 Tax=Streptomyces sp. NPDC102278 TaxID=3366152 RepID=UPI003814D588
MEHYRTRSVRHPRERVPRQQAPGAARPARPVPARRRLPRPRLTGLGGGLFACVAMAVVAGVVWLLFDASLFAYGLLFLPVAATTALWVRPADLITAPISAPIAFAVGVWPVSGGSGGFGGQLMGIVSALSLHAGWLYAGTVVAALIALVRKAVLIGKRRMPRRAA